MYNSGESFVVCKALRVCDIVLIAWTMRPAGVDSQIPGLDGDFGLARDRGELSLLASF